MGQIYCIKNTVNGKCYVGQTKLTFSLRYSGGWEKRTRSTVLRQALSKYGHENFVVEILEECPNESLNEREAEWAEKLNCYSPCGYNLRKCGEAMTWIAPRSQEFRDKIGKLKKGQKVSQETRAKKSKPVRCLDNGEIYPSLIEAARQLGIRQGHISENLYGKRPHVRGFHFEWVDKEIL